MDIKKIVRKMLLEQNKTKYEYGCVMINLNVAKDDWTRIQDIIKDTDIYTGEENSGYGRELEPHVTILYGITKDVPIEDVEKLIKKIKKPDIKLTKISSFENELFDVLKFDVISEDLIDLNSMFKELPHTSTYPNYSPHATICYLKKGVVKEYIKKLSETKPLEISSDKVIYSKPTSGDNPEKEYYNI